MSNEVFVLALVVFGFLLVMFSSSKGSGMGGDNCSPKRAHKRPPARPWQSQPADNDPTLFTVRNPK